MFYQTQLIDHIRVPPSLFGLTLEEAITKRILSKYEGFISKDIGFVIDVAKIDEVSDGVIIPGDGAMYYKTTFELLTFKPELHEVLMGRIKDLADFGAFLTIGPADGMVHISQTMDDFVSYSKDKILLGRDTKRTLKAGDLCRARIIAVSFKDIENPKLGLTMRQAGLGKLEWADEDFSKGDAKETPTKKKKK